MCSRPRNPQWPRAHVRAFAGLLRQGEGRLRQAAEPPAARAARPSAQAAEPPTGEAGAVVAEVAGVVVPDRDTAPVVGPGPDGQARAQGNARERLERLAHAGEAGESTPLPLVG